MDGLLLSFCDNYSAQLVRLIILQRNLTSAIR
jgi:hypothetical protein